MYAFKPYPVCTGGQPKYRVIRKLYRPYMVMFESHLCNCFIKEANKTRFLKQLFRWFFKEAIGFKVEPFLKNPNTCNIVNGDIICFFSRMQKPSLKKLLSKLNYKVVDYKYLKRRSYALDITFVFAEMHLSNKNILLDIKVRKRDVLSFIIVTNSGYLSDFLQILFYFYLEIDTIDLKDVQEEA